VQVIAEAGDSASLVPAVERYVQWLTGAGAQPAGVGVTGSRGA
jgi:hypothetical protein